MSTHEVRVVRIGELRPHQNADRLQLVDIGGYTCVVQKDAWKPGDLAAFIEPDYVVPETPQFAFLGNHRRIGAKKLRGVWSEGLLTTPPAGAIEGDNVMEAMGIERFVPRIKSFRPGVLHGIPIGLADDVPPLLKGLHKYDIENLKKFTDVFHPGELVYVTEKLHGSNARYVFKNGRMWCGGRTQWRAQTPKTVYWEALAQNPWIEEWCRQFPGTVLYGEAFGQVSDLTYGAKQGQIFFRAFDVMEPFPLPGEYLNPMTFCAVFDEEHRVPCIGFMEFDFAKLLELAEEPSSLGGGVREGLVIKPIAEREHHEIGRVFLKLISRGYLSR